MSIITETMNNNRKDIVRSSGKYFVLWGMLLTVFSLLVFILWKTTGKAVWNNLWFALPAIGYPLARLIKSKEMPARAENYISRINGGIWGSFGLFACSVALFTILYSLLGDSQLTATAQIVLLFGIAETISGFVLKNWTIKIAGWITGIGGLAIFYITQAGGAEQMFIFTFAGIVLSATGLIVKQQYK